jgi:chorismate mutase
MMTVTNEGLISSVDDGRARLDAIDNAIIELLAQRKHVSKQVQALRVEAGGSRVEHSRENAIIRRWSDALGESGVELAMAVLHHCRGRATDA